MSVTVIDSATVAFETQNLQGAFKGAKLAALKDASGRPLLEAAGGPAGVELLFADGEAVPLAEDAYAHVQAVQISRTVAHIHVEHVEGDACLRVSTDPAGRLVIEPSAQTLRGGLGAVRLNLAGVAPGLKLIAPLYQGCRQELEHPLVAGGHFAWPHYWEAALAILQGPAGGWSVRCHDRRCLPKALHVGHPAEVRTLGLDIEAIGPWDRNTAVGGLAWVVEAHAGQWEAPVRQYRTWLWEAYGLSDVADLRPEWAGQVCLTLQWCPCEPAILDAVAGVIEPRRVLIHVPSWRADPYDENYPEYVPSQAGAAFIAEALGRGFRALPHFNYFTIDPGHPFFPRVREFLLRDVRSKRILGWRWKDRAGLPFPQALGRLDKLRSEKTMAYVHAASSTWRRQLVRRIAAAAAELRVPGVFVDQTLCTDNADNGLVENHTPMEGMLALTRELCELDGRLGVGGEGRNELSMQYQSFAQAHLFRSWHSNCERFEELDPVPVGELLYGDLCRSMGYTALAGDTPAGELRLRAHEKLGALPSLTVSRPEQIEAPTPAVKRVLERAASGGP